MVAYEAWRNVMYCVGVFVTCNVGGVALASVMGRLSRRKAHAVPDALSDGGRKAHPFDDLPFDEMARYSDIENAADADKPSEWQGQDFGDIRRQVEAADSNKAAPERVTPDELAEAYRKSAPAPDAEATA